MKIDFEELKARVSIEECAAWLGIKLKDKTRGQCPFCEHDRTFTLTPDKGLFGCFQCERRGSIIDLTMMVHQLPLREAAKLIHQQFIGTVNRPAPAEQRTVPTTESGHKSGDFDLAKHKANLEKIKARLLFTGEVMEALGLSEEVARATGIGYDPKQKRVLQPVYVNGEHLDYSGLATTGDQAPLILFYKNLAQIVASRSKQEEAPQPQSSVASFLRVVK